MAKCKLDHLFKLFNLKDIYIIIYLSTEQKTTAQKEKENILCDILSAN